MSAIIPIEGTPFSYQAPHRGPTSIAERLCQNGCQTPNRSPRRGIYRVLLCDHEYAWCCKHCFEELPVLWAGALDTRDEEAVAA